MVHAQIKPALPLQKHPFTVIAHRGDHVIFPENTLAAFEAAIQHEVDYVEADLRTTKDSELVIMHDATVDRMTNGRGKLAEKTFAELKQLTIKSKNPSDTTLYNIPGFDELLALCKGRIHIYLDFKDASVEQAFNAISRQGMERQVIVYINSWQQYRDWRAIAPAIPLIVSLPDTIKTAEALRAFAKANPVSLLDGDFDGYNQPLLEAARQENIVVWPDIQSAGEQNNWDRAIAFGFTGLQTDHPADLIKYLQHKGLR
jgi:glycerophosphoryl diester phosphodiesterase